MADLATEAQVLMKQEKKEKPPSSGALIRYKNNLLFMKRDNNPKIPDPGKLGIIGGKMEPGESVEVALIREANEEAGLNIDRSQIQRMGVLVGGDDQDHKKNISCIELREDQATNLTLGQEGHKLVWVTTGMLEEMDESGRVGGYEFVPDLLVILRDHKAGVLRWLKGENIESEDIGLTPTDY